MLKEEIPACASQPEEIQTSATRSEKDQTGAGQPNSTSIALKDEFVLVISQSDSITAQYTNKLVNPTEEHLNPQQSYLHSSVSGVQNNIASDQCLRPRNDEV